MAARARLLIARSALRAGTHAVTGEDHHYLFRVLRLAPGAVVTLCDGEGREAAAVVRAVGPASAELDVGEVRALPPPRCAVTVLQAVIKGERMTWCIEKLVELGVAEIVPVQAARSVVRLDGERADRRHRRWQETARAAARQCRRGHAPRVLAVHALADALDRVRAAPLRLVAWEDEASRGIADVLGDVPGEAAGDPPGAACVLIGPEGGFEPAELTAIETAGFIRVSLGPHVLRAETAAVAAAAMVGFAVGDLGRPAGPNN